MRNLAFIIRGYLWHWSELRLKDLVTQTPSRNIYHLEKLSLVPSFVTLPESLALGLGESPGWSGVLSFHSR